MPLQVFRSWSKEDVHIVWIYSSDFILSLFHKMKMLGILCMQHLQFNGDSFETLQWCLGHGLKTCILSLFHKMNLVIILAKVNRY